MDHFDRQRNQILKLFENVSSDEESEKTNIFTDDGTLGTYGDDPDYVINISSDEEDLNLFDELNDSKKMSISRDGSPAVSADDSDSESETNDVEEENEPENKWYEDIKDIPQLNFDIGNSGIRINVHVNSSPKDVFDQIFDKDILEKIVNSTNEYGTNLCETTRPQTRYARNAIFKKINNDEMEQFLGLCLLQGQIKVPRIQNLFANDPLYFHPIFPHIMNGRRFEQILRCLSCSADTEDESKLKKIQPLLKLFIASFQRACYPSEYLSLDESLLLFRGRLSFRQYIKGKKAKYGIKLYEITTSDGYVLNIEIYQEKTDDKTKGKIENLVTGLMSPYLNKGHHLIMDNYYNSVNLSRILLEHKTHVTGTLRSNRKGNPKDVIDEKLLKGGYIWRRQGSIYVSKWRDKRDVLAITTGNHPEIVNTINKYGKILKKPKEISIYNTYMAGIDRTDQMTSYYSSPRKTIRWYKKLIFHFLDISVWNSFYIYKKKTISKLSFMEFRDILIKSLIKLPSNIKSGRVLSNFGNRSSTFAHSDTHFMEKIPVSDGRKRKVAYLRCKQCSKEKLRKETSFRCKNCPDNVALCAGKCFELYHLSMAQI